MSYLEPLPFSVAIDVDGVLANTIKRGLQRAAALLSRDDLHHDMIQTWAMEDSLGLVGEMREKFYQHWRERGFVAGMEPYENTYVGYDRIAALCDTYIATAPFSNAPHWIPEREEWLAKHFNVDHHKIIHTNAKHLIDVQVLVEDKTSTLVKWKKYHPTGTAIRIRRNYNKDEPFDGVEVADMIEAADVIEALVRRG